MGRYLVVLGCEKTLGKGRRPSLGAKVCCRCLVGWAVQEEAVALGVWCDGDSFFTCLQLSRQLRLGPFCGIGLILQDKLFPAIPSTHVITYGNHRLAGLNRVSVPLPSCSFAAGLSLARWACLEFPQVVLVLHNGEGRCWKESCRLSAHWESEGREVNAR